jgi:predicted ATPase/DNA-binding SARP family transcriptional activator
VLKESFTSVETMPILPASQPCYRLQFLGKWSIFRGNQEIFLETKKTCALLAYLAMSPKPCSRDRLAGLLWGDLPQTRARRNLRHALWNLRSQLDLPGAPELIQVESERVFFQKQAGCQLDVDEFQKKVGHFAAIKREANNPAPILELQQAVDLYQGDFLEDLTLKDVSEWDEWMLVERERLRSLALAGLERLIEAYRSQDQLEQAILCARKLTGIDLWRESTHRSLMALLALAGRTAEALAQYEVCRQILERELGAAPTPETQALFKQIASGAFSQATVISPSLPAQSDGFIGRKRELAELAGLLADDSCRLITIHGAGGVGKTRLALQAAAQAEATFPGGVKLVSLAELRTSEEFMHALTSAFDPKPEIPPFSAPERGEKGGSAAWQRLLAFFHSMIRPTLVLLDDFDTLVPCARLLSDLLAANPRLKLIVTSRIVLNLRGEYIYALAPLELPDLETPPASAELGQIESIALFVERARQVKTGFGLNKENALSVARICACLDGLPLAIELAAARSKLLSPQAILAYLCAAEGPGALHFLSGSLRDQPERQRTLGKTIEWSYTLVDPAGQRLFARLGIFIDGFTLQSAGEVGSDNTHLQDGDVFTTLTTLLDTSLIRRVEGAGGEPRFSMLQTLRDYALERLRDRHESDAVRRRHAEFFLKLAESAGAGLKGPQQEVWLKRLEAENGNLRAALQWAIDQHAVVLGLSLAGALWRYWYARGDLFEGRQWLERLLALGEDMPVPAAVRARALNGAGVLARNQGDFCQAARLLEMASGLFREAQDGSSQAEVLGSLGATLNDQGSYLQARAFFEECLRLQESQGDVWGQAMTLSNLATNLIVCNEDHARAHHLLEKSLALRRNLGDKTGMGYTLNNLGVVSLRLGDIGQAERLVGESLAIFRGLGNKVGIVVALNSLGEIVWERGNLSGAAGLYCEGLQICRETGDKEDTVIALEELAHIALAQRLPDRGCRLLGAAEALRDQMGLQVYPDERLRHAQLVQKTMAQLAQPAFSQAWAQGRLMTFAQAIDYANEKHYREEQPA